MRTQRQVVDYALQRRALLADVGSGRVGTASVCDAGPYLLRAARFHGEQTEQTCPVCRAKVEGSSQLVQAVKAESVYSFPIFV